MSCHKDEPQSVPQTGSNDVEAIVAEDKRMSLWILSTITVVRAEQSVRYVCVSRQPHLPEPTLDIQANSDHTLESRLAICA